MSNIKITYFNGRGLAETNRMLLKYGNIDFEDVRVEREKWPELKPSTPFGQLPLYEEDGKVVWQSVAVARYLARKVKLAGDTEWDNLEIDAIVDTITDFRLKIVPFYTETDEEKKAVLKETLLKETIPFYLDKLEKIAEQNNGYLAAKKFTWADIFFVNIIALFTVLLKEDIIGDRGNLKGLSGKIEEIPALKEWIESRPRSEF